MGEQQAPTEPNMTKTITSLYDTHADALQTVNELRGRDIP